VKVEISVSEIVEVFQRNTRATREDFGDGSGRCTKVVGEYLSDIMQVELTRFLGRKAL